ncbi:MAG: response regulator transcription factor [Burkholderiaceae bacterium]
MTVAEQTNGGARVLLIEDNKDVRKLFTIILERAGMRVTSLADGREAMNLLDEGDLPEVVVMDRMLPGLPGDLILNRMRAHARWADIPIVIVSALRRRFDISELLRAGANAYLQKPVDTRELVATVKTAIDGGASRRQMATESLESAIPRAPAREAVSAVGQSRSADLIDP